MPRYKFTVEYDGTSFAGWQRQNNAPSVQQAIEEALHMFIPQEDITLFVAGRTDAGVHARGQVAHVDLHKTMLPDVIRRAVNAHLVPHPVVVLAVEEVPDTFHARFSAISRTYEYILVNRLERLTIHRAYAWWVPYLLDVKRMEAGAEFFLGQHDFSAFRTVQCQAKNPIRTLSSFTIKAYEDFIVFKVEAPSFLHHQVRNMVGTLIEVGRGKRVPESIRRTLESRKRSEAGPTAPAHGLYLMRVTY